MKLYPPLPCPPPLPPSLLPSLLTLGSLLAMGATKFKKCLRGNRCSGGEREGGRAGSLLLLLLGRARPRVSRWITPRISCSIAAWGRREGGREGDREGGREGWKERLVYAK